MIKYQLICGFTTENDRLNHSYGIKIVRGRRCIRVIRDISDDKERICRLIRELNELSPDPIHIDEIIEDFLCDV